MSNRNTLIKEIMKNNAPETGRGTKSVPRRRNTATKTPVYHNQRKTIPRGAATKSASGRGGGVKRPANQVRRGRKPGSRNKNPRKDKGGKKGRRAPAGMLVAELLKSISKWKKKNKIGATPKTQNAMVKFMDKHKIPIGYGLG